MASFAAGVSPSPPFISRRLFYLPASPPLSVFPLRQSKSWTWRVKCEPSEEEPVPDAETPPSRTLSSSSSLSPSISAYNWCAALGGVGFLETAYLTYLKLSNSEAFCPTGGGGSCGDVLNSEYAVVFGVPLPIIGMVAYGLVTTLSLQLSGRSIPLGISESNGRSFLLTSTASMAAASGYFLYILNTRFSGISCSYCLFSVLLSFGLFFITLKEFRLQELQRLLGIQLSIAILVIVSLNASYGSFQSATSSTAADLNLEFFTSEITTSSSPFALALAKHLHSIGAKMYGAFWCSHCVEQKQMFGKEASEILDYVECFPNGFRQGMKMVKACADAKPEGFPTWVINGEVLSGEQELSELARVSGFKFDDVSQAG
ncbi:hypothetical protein K2173_006242 [Erythroxylum novogranatense]|uniref:Vitamin K epoxide reductase domain-containing protein n=1 Tax=Erythroxylum novogranatense TaxID=1862640 RepID=A0AAV8TCA4_9ROSI|nr:hypothetical protein K2173_006242 [Erythroxylum novogranatense]